MDEDLSGFGEGLLASDASSSEPSEARPFQVRRSGKWEPLRLNYSHEALIDQIMANPTASNAQLGAVFGRTKEWVSMVKTSGLFREQMAKKRLAIIDPVLAANVEERLEMVTLRSLEVLQEKLAQPTEKISDELALQAAAFGAKGMGLGGFSAKSAPPAPAPSLDRIDRLADRLMALNGRPQPQEISDAKVLAEVRQ